MRLSIEIRKFANPALFTGGLILMLMLGLASTGMCNTVDGLNHQPEKTPKVGDPVSVDTGEALMTFPLFHLPGPMPIDLTLYYMSQAVDSPSVFGSRFFLNVPYMWRTNDDISVTFVNGMDEVEFQKNIEDDWEMIGHSSWPYELKAAGGSLFLQKSCGQHCSLF